jgi:hypothetical protein
VQITADDELPSRKRVKDTSELTMGTGRHVNVTMEGEERHEDAAPKKRR